MQRRGFLGTLVGALAAGPSMAKRAAAEAMTFPDLNLDALGIASPGDPVPSNGVPTPTTLAAYLAQISQLTREQHAFHIARTGVYALDPDLAGYRSFSMATKVRMQQQRNYWRELELRKGWLEARIAGWIEG